MGQATWSLARLYDGKYSVRYGGQEMYLLDPQYLPHGNKVTPVPNLLSQEQADAIERMMNELTRRAEQSYAMPA